MIFVVVFFFWRQLTRSLMNINFLSESGELSTTVSCFQASVTSFNDQLLHYTPQASQGQSEISVPSPPLPALSPSSLFRLLFLPFSCDLFRCHPFLRQVTRGPPSLVSSNLSRFYLSLSFSFSSHASLYSQLYRLCLSSSLILSPVLTSLPPLAFLNPNLNFTSC